MNEREVNADYDKALNSLKKLNNDLFYSELKDKLEKHLEEVKSRYERTIQQIDGMVYTVQGLPMQLHDNLSSATEEFKQTSEDIIANTTEEINNRFKEKEENLSQIIECFAALQDNFSIIQQNYMEQLKEFKAQILEWQKEQKEVLTNSLEKIQEVVNTTADKMVETQDEFYKKLQVDIENNFLITNEAIKQESSNIADILNIVQERCIEQFENLHKENENLSNTIDSQKKAYENRCATLEELIDNRHKSTNKTLIGIALGEFLIIIVVLLLRFL